MLRLNGERFETSQGADVPRAEGVAMLEFIARTLHAGLAPQVYDDGPKAGGFPLRSITAEEITVGCHHIPMAECAAMAALVGVEWPQS